MIHKTLLEISETESEELLKIVHHWKQFTDTTVLLAILEMKRRKNFNFGEETVDKISQFSSYKGKSFSTLRDEFLLSKDVETYDEYYDFKVKLSDKNSRERIKLERAKMQKTLNLDKAHKHEAKKDILYGVLWLVGGLAVTILTFNFGSIGFIAYGAIIFGGIRFFRGLANII
ncbi:hypothetical protein [uncultured Chryseobacterium sp.]|uniref:hypothetical protein n=1 Tax=uncultured Chryseobacterium sp. TaxID=259322 RepID=UPI0025E0FE9F|nr:hypothetical protein [uncultured Chryseobacterium sp.]